MNRILYLLTGAALAGVIALAFFQKHDLAKANSTDAMAIVGFFLAFAAAAVLLAYSGWGRRLRLRVNEKTMDEDDRVRTNARTKGEVRPPIGS